MQKENAIWKKMKKMVRQQPPKKSDSLAPLLSLHLHSLSPFPVSFLLLSSLLLGMRMRRKGNCLLLPSLSRFRGSLRRSG